MGIRPLDIQSPISTIEWDGREGRADGKENHNEGKGLFKEALYRMDGVGVVFEFYIAHLYNKGET